MSRIRINEPITPALAVRVSRDWACEYAATEYASRRSESVCANFHANAWDYIVSEKRRSSLDKSKRPLRVFAFRKKSVAAKPSLMSIPMDSATEHEIMSEAIRLFLVTARPALGDVLNAVTLQFPDLRGSAPPDVIHWADEYSLESVDTEQRALELADDVRFALMSGAVKLGLDRARERGIKLGRPFLAIDPEHIRALSAAGLSIRKIAAQTGVSVGTVHNLLKSEPQSQSVANGDDCPF